MRLVPLGEACRDVARGMIGHRDLADGEVGGVALWAHQRDAVTRLRAAIAEFGGALLADDVGTGKTFTALAVASRYAAPLVVAPAGLRERWRDAGERVGRVPRFVSFQSLSRGRRPPTGHDFVIVDEAHHARNPLARRYRELAALIASVPALLLTATPIHNRRDDLLALLELFLGARAASLDDAALARCIVRRGREVLAGGVRLPAVHGPIALSSDSDDDATPDAILALPPPVPTADGGTAAALLTITLLRQWASSQGALLAAVRRRLAAAHALAATLDTGRYPTRAELDAWTLGDDAQQLVMAELLSPVQDEPPAAALRASVDAHITGLRVIRRAASADPAVDSRRAARLGDIRRAHPRARCIAFTQFAETVDAYWRELRGEPRVCALTAQGGRVASGTISRRETLGSFAPGGRPVEEARRIDLLLATDLASEGLDLQEASVLVHLDLPWTPARIEQRLGRVVRPGSRHDAVHVYTMDPPIRAAALLDIRRRLADKLAAARTALGAVMPDLGLGDDSGASPAPASGSSRGGSREPCLTLAVPDAAERIERILSGWRNIDGDGRDDFSHADIPRNEPTLAITHATAAAWLALLDGDAPSMVASLGGEVGDSPALVASVSALIDAARGSGAAPPIADDLAATEQYAVAAARELSRWLDDRRAAALAGIPDISVVRTRRRALAAIASLATASASTRAAHAATANRALSAATRPLGASRERELRDLAAAEAGRPAHSLLDSIAAFAAPTVARPASPPDAARVQALIVLIPQG